MKDYKKARNEFTFNFANLNLKQYDICFEYQSWPSSNYILRFYKKTGRGIRKYPYKTFENEHENLLPRFDFSGSDLSGCDISFSFRYGDSKIVANFSQANLENATIRLPQTVSLFCAKFKYSNLKNCTFNNPSIFIDSDFESAQVTDLKFVQPKDDDKFFYLLTFINTDIKPLKKALPKYNGLIYSFASERDYDRRQVLCFLSMVVSIQLIVGGVTVLVPTLCDQREWSMTSTVLPHLQLGVAIACGLITLGLVFAAGGFWQHKKFLCDFQDEAQQNLPLTMSRGSRGY